MPNIILRNTNTETIKILSKNLSIPLSDAIGCPIDWITFSSSDFPQVNFCNGNLIEDVFVDVYWFPREKKIKDNVAKIFIDNLSNNGKIPVIVIFHDLVKDNYYES